MKKKGDVEQFVTRSGYPVKRVYDHRDVQDLDPDKDLGEPGSAPYTRGAYPNMYRERPWRIFQLSGYGLPEDEGARIRFLLETGEMGFIMEPDLLTCWHLYDLDDPEVVCRKDDVGQTGATLLSLRDYEIALEGIHIEMTYAHPGAVTPQLSPFAHACYFSVAEKRGIPLSQLRGTGEGDMIIAYLATPGKEPIPPSAGIRLNCDLIEFCIEKAPKWVPVSISAANARAGGLYKNEHELALTLANAIAYVDEILSRGKLKIDDFAYKIAGVGLSTGGDFFEDIAKYRAARRMWHKLMKERYGAQAERSLRLRLHTNVGASMCSYQQPLNNIVRTTCGALAAALAGTQSMGLACYDEAICIPTEHAHMMAVRTQQILQLEIGITDVVDPLGGSYYVEWLTNEVEKRSWQYLEEIEKRGGLVGALESGWLHLEAKKGLLEQQRQLMNDEFKFVGVNCFLVEEEPHEIQVFRSPRVYEQAKARQDKLKRERDNKKAQKALDKLRAVCKSGENVMPALMEAVKADVTAGEVGNLWREVFSTWEAPLPI